MHLLNQGKGLRRVVEPAIIAALYVVLTFLSASFGLAYSGVQLRLSEALTILPVLTPFAVPGLTIGCFISNITSPFGLVDLIFGTFATLLASYLTRLLRDIKFKDIPILSPLPSVIINAAFIPLLICFTMPDGFSLNVFFITSGLIALGQFIVCYFLGIPLYIVLKRTGIFKS